MFEILKNYKDAKTFDENLAAKKGDFELLKIVEKINQLSSSGKEPLFMPNEKNLLNAITIIETQKTISQKLPLELKIRMAAPRLIWQTAIITACLFIVNFLYFTIFSANDDITIPINKAILGAEVSSINLGHQLATQKATEIISFQIDSDLEKISAPEKTENQ